MSIIVKNTTNSDITPNGTGQTISANGQYTIKESELHLWQSSDDLFTKIGSQDLVVNDSSSDLSVSDGIDHIKRTFPKKIGISEPPPFAAKTIIVNGVEKSLYKRIHGIKSSSIASGQQVNIDFVITYNHVKFTGAEVFGTELGDTIDFYVLDDSNNTYSGAPTESPGYPNYLLNQFGFLVEMPADRYMNSSDYDADLYINMIIRCKYKNNGASPKTISMNVWLHEVL
jgi:hypothetical protein